ncbi:MAG: potassium transporter Kup [Verrucomicrobium sp.]|nr:potassium transporter Kup [Chthoniobacter sp.]
MHDSSRQKALSLSIGALGVVYGDIGTSVLYAFKECLAHGLSTEKEIVSVLSLILWTLFTLVSVKYLWQIMRADNQGEGGILTLLSLAVGPGPSKGKSWTGGLLVIGLAGAALLYGDGVITPAVTLLSATEGLEIATEKLHPFIIPLTLGILCALFAVQSKGTGTIGKFFGPVMLVWFATLAVLGVFHIAQNPSVLRALNPLEALDFFRQHSTGSLAIMGSVFLVVTGGEALYADMGHFGREPIARAWTWLVCPALILNYLGQGALVLLHPEARENPFFHMVPDLLLYPLIAIATAASVIASQALISGAFSLTMQGIQMGYIPRMEILHTSKDEHGQIYIPKVNVMLGIGCAVLVATFRSSSALASAYGIAVTLTMLATTALFYVAAQRLWGWHPVKAGLFCALFGVIELTFFAANALKVLHGGWLPLAAGAVIFTIMTTWKAGRQLLRNSMPASMSLDDFIGSITLAGTLSEQNRLHRTRGTAVFLASNPAATPNAMLKNITHNQILHTRNIILTMLTDRDRPHVPAAERVEIEDKTEGFFRLVAHFGFMETPDIAEVIRAAKAAGLPIERDKCTYFIGKERIIATAKLGIALWREHLFVFLSKNSENAADFFQLPPDRVYEVSHVVEI